MWKMIVLCLFLMIGGPKESLAEGHRSEIEFYVGHYIPLKVAWIRPGQSTAAHGERNEKDIAVGSRLSVILIGQIGFEGVFLFSPSKSSWILPGGSNIWAASARFAAYNTRAKTKLRIGINAGLALVGAGGEVLDYRERHGLGGVFGAMMSVPISDQNRLRFDVEAYFYNRGWDRPIRSTGWIKDNLIDLVFSAGIVFPLPF
jgi:hypothetical protein